MPLALAPVEIVTWTYRVACLGCVRYLLGSLRAVGLALLFVPLQIELIALNVTLPIAAAARMALRGPVQASGAGLIPLTAALKFGTVLLGAYLWAVRPDLRRPMLYGAVGLAVVFGLHALIDPDSWRAYVASLGQQGGSANAAPWVGEQLLFLLPSTLGDFVLRIGIGVVLVAVAIWRRWDWLAFGAAAVAVPTMWVARLAALVAVPRLIAEAVGDRGSVADARQRGLSVP